MKPASESIAAVVPIAGSDWTDDQWAAREEEVRAQIADRDAPGRARRIETVLVKLGWPARAVEAAKKADPKRGAVEPLMNVDFAATNIVVLAGAPGCGKTVGAAHWAMTRSHGASFLRASTFAASSRYSAEDRKIWFDASALVLDDLGAEYLDAKGSFLVDLDELVDTYYGNLKPLVVTTNATTKQFVDRYGERVRDRLRESARWISIGTPSLRGRP